MEEREQLDAWKREADQKREQDRKALEQRSSQHQPKPPIQQESQQEKDHREFELKKRILELNGGKHMVCAVSDKFLRQPGNSRDSRYSASYTSKVHIGDLTERQAAQVLYVLEEDQRDRERKEYQLTHPPPPYKGRSWLERTFGNYQYPPGTWKDRGRG